jgi:hypothetical protein
MICEKLKKDWYYQLNFKKNKTTIPARYCVARMMIIGFEKGGFQTEAGDLTLFISNSNSKEIKPFLNNGGLIPLLENYINRNKEKLVFNELIQIIYLN